MNTRFLFLALITIFLSANFQNCSSSSSEGNNKEASLSSQEQKPQSSSTEKEEKNSPVSNTDAKEVDNSVEEEEVKEETKEPSAESDILFIREKFGIISKATNYKTDSFSAECGGGKTSFERKSNDKKEVVYLKREDCGDHGCFTKHHYFWDGELIFIFTQHSYWAGNTDFMAEQRIYVKNGKMFRCLEKKVSSQYGNPKIEDLMKKTANSEVDCTPDKMTKNLEELKTLSKEKAQSYLCE